MQDNLFYLDGPHGSGKTTLARELEKRDSKIVIPELFSRNVKFHTSPDYRQILKICGRAIENFEYLEFAKNNPEKIVLGNRCVYGVLAYNWVYYKRGWIDEENYNMLNLHTRDCFKYENQSPLAIILNPGFETVRRHLQKRWGEAGKKWREDDERYTELACLAYEQFKNLENVLYIPREADFESGRDVNECFGWMEGVRGRKLEEVIVQ